MGTETSTNCPRCSDWPMCGTKLPSKMPMTMARKIQTARKRSSHPRDLNAEVFLSVGEDTRPHSRTLSVGGASSLASLVAMADLGRNKEECQVRVIRMRIVMAFFVVFLRKKLLYEKKIEKRHACWPKVMWRA